IPALRSERVITGRRITSRNILKGIELASQRGAGYGIFRKAYPSATQSKILRSLIPLIYRKQQVYAWLSRYSNLLWNSDVQQLESTQFQIWPASTQSVKVDIDPMVEGTSLQVGKDHVREISNFIGPLATVRPYLRLSPLADGLEFQIEVLNPFVPLDEIERWLDPAEQCQPATDPMYALLLNGAARSLALSGGRLDYAGDGVFAMRLGVEVAV
ncbi:MAG: hypothetical protein AAF125_21685, partial [Chloroflexota bacterium]